MSHIFLGKPIHWLVVAIIMGVLAWLGFGLVQTRDYSFFLFILVAVTVGSVGVIMLTTRKGEQVTREPFEDDSAG
ncbi:MAG: hypothetical protein HQ514_11210 [Rhodospirillales bacterium]|nr:hypothetical protein [Rhodospirillales bacterium]